MVHCKKRLAIFPSSAGIMSLTKLSLAGNNLTTVIPARVSLVSDILAGDGKIANLFYSVEYYLEEGEGLQLLPDVPVVLLHHLPDHQVQKYEYVFVWNFKYVYFAISDKRNLVKLIKWKFVSNVNISRFTKTNFGPMFQFTF